MDVIKNWLKNPFDAVKGVELFAQVSSNKKLLHYFKTAPITAFYQKKLTAELAAILLQPATTASKSTPLKKTSAPEPSGSQNITAGWLPPEQRSSIEQVLHNKWRPVFSRMMNLMARLDDVARQGINNQDKEDEAGRMALEIIELDMQVDDIYQQRNYARQHNSLPAQKKQMQLAVDPTLWPLKLHNHQRYVREFRVKLKKEPDNLKYAANLQKHEWAVAEYKKLLKQ